MVGRADQKDMPRRMQAADYRLLGDLNVVLPYQTSAPWHQAVTSMKMSEVLFSFARAKDLRDPFHGIPPGYPQPLAEVSRLCLSTRSGARPAGRPIIDRSVDRREL